jgi:hypothetical protein
VNSLALPAAITLAGYAAGYTLMCLIFPFGHCRRCKGLGKLYSPFSHKVFRLCPRCDGTGRRVRIGRRIYEHFRRDHKAGNR